MLLHELLEALEELPGLGRVANEIEHRGNPLLLTGRGRGGKMTEWGTAGSRMGLMLKGDSRLASSHLEIYVSLFQPTTTVVFKEIPSEISLKTTVAGWNKDTYISSNLLHFCIGDLLWP